MLKTAFVISLISISCLHNLQVASCDSSKSAHSKHNELPDPSSNAINNPLDEPKSYRVIVDCGSSGSKVHIYQFKSDLNKITDYQKMLNDTALPQVSNKFLPGLSKFAFKELSKLQTYVKRVADYISSNIPRDRHRSTAIYVLATAGMRLLDVEKQDEVMLRVKDYFEQNYNFIGIQTRVISGSDEGMYQWISINAKAGRFLGQSTNDKTPTFGVIEMGGASVQITYQLQRGDADRISKSLKPEASKVYLEHIVEPLISRRDPKNTYKLHSTTFLGFGSDSARNAYLDLLIDWRYKGHEKLSRFIDVHTKSYFTANFGSKRQAKNAIKTLELRGLTIDDPCRPEGNVTLISKPRQIFEDFKKKIGYIKQNKNLDSKFKVTVRGTGNYNKCKENVKTMLWAAKNEMLFCKPEEKELNKCTMSLIGAQFIHLKEKMDLLAVSDFYYTTNMLNVSVEYNHDEVVKKTKIICNSSIEELERDYFQYPEEKRMSLCFKAVWVDTLLVEGFRLPVERPLNLLTQGGTDGWTLGAVLDKSFDILEATERREV